jgi:hypothetical protein
MEEADNDVLLYFSSKACLCMARVMIDCERASHRTARGEKRNEKGDALVDGVGMRRCRES